MESRPRRNRKSASLRALLTETVLLPSDFVLPLFIKEGQGVKEPISSMPGQFRLSIDEMLKICAEAKKLKIPAIALFPVIEDKLKDSKATESKNAKGLIPKAIAELKNKFPELTVITDVAMDPYSSDGHDGFVEKGEIINDLSLPILAEQAIAQAKAGADIVAPSDMMDGRVGFIRDALDDNGFSNTGILAYSAKYASGFYGPFREALDSAPRFGDKKTYQMNPANAREALREAFLDETEGADILMVKPALAYLDVIARLKEATTLPIAAYHVSGEYAMIMAAAEKGWLDGEKCMMESLTSIKRSGADMIFSYYALQAAKIVSEN